MENKNFNLSGMLKERRLELGLSLSQLAYRTNTSAATLSRYESGWSRFEIYTLRKLASALGCRLRVELEPLADTAGQESTATAVKKLQRLFWDKPLLERDFDEFPLWVIKRVLEYGTLSDVQVLIGIVGKNEFLESVSKIKFSSMITQRFWQKILDREGYKCTRKSSRQGVEMYWPA